MEDINTDKSDNDSTLDSDINLDYEDYDSDSILDSASEDEINNLIKQAKSSIDNTNFDVDANCDSHSDIDNNSDNENEINNSEEQEKSNIIPVKSKRLYEIRYAKLKDWCLQRQTTKTDEKVILDYFKNLSENSRANTLWAVYNRLKPMLLIKESIDISKYEELLCFLKEKVKTEQLTSKTTKVFTKEEVSKFLKTAPDDEYLLHKVALVIGVYGCLRVIELSNLETNDIKEQDGLYQVTIPTTETSREKSFVLNEEASGIVSKYVKVRPEGMERFFLLMRNNKCIRQNVGKPTLSSLPIEIAEFLNLSEPELYTGYIFRRTGVSLLADGGDETLGSKNNSECESNAVEEEDINQLIKNKTNIIRMTKKSITPTSNMDLLIPDHSKPVYKRQYKKFKDWCVKRKETEMNEELILVYFKELSKNFKATSLWAIYSRLRAMILIEESIDISTYLELHHYLKKQKQKHIPKQSKIFTKEEVFTFLKTAPDNEFLLHKVVLIIGLYGCLRQVELLKMNIDNIKQEGNLCHVSLPDTKTNKEKSFIINEEASAIIIKYMQLRIEGVKRFFQLYHNKKCIRQNLGKLKLCSIPKEIAKFLNLPDPELYTGHTFIRSSTMLLVEKEADIQALRKQCECQSNTAPQEDINDPLQNEIDTNSLIPNSINSMDTEEPEISASITSSISTCTKSLYEQQYEKFKEWCKQWQAKEIDENILLTYFRTLSISFKATTLLSIYTRLKPMLLSKESIDISKYLELQSFLKEKSKQHTVKTTKVFTKEEVSTFLKTAPDDKFLLHKVVLIIGLYGHLPIVDLLKMNANNVKPQGNLYVISIPIKQTGNEKLIILNEEASAIISKYVKLRPKGMKQFFLQMRNRKCIRQHVGKNLFSSLPKDIAKFLNLSDPELYTGHAIMRCSTMLQADKSDKEAYKLEEEVDIPALEENGESNSFLMDGTMQSHINQNQWIPAVQYNNQGINNYNYNNYNDQENLASPRSDAFWSCTIKNEYSNE